MQIIGFNLTKISVQRKEKLEGKLEIKQNINIDDITKDKINISDNEVLKMSFTFKVDYSPEFADVELKGNVILLPDKEEFKEIIKSWKKKELTDKYRVPLFNFIMGKCNIKALALEDEMSLPLHIPMPKLSPKKQEA